MAEQIQKVKGTNDILPGEVERWQALEHIIRQIMARYNYREIRTPIFEHTDLFTRGVGTETDIVSKEMYTFQDMSGNRLTLRPELTASVVRSFIQHNLQQNAPVQKLWYEGPMFRQERPQKGRYRQFWQFGMEAIGSPHPEQDVEAIAVFIGIMDALGIRDHVVLNINSIGDTDSRDRYREALRDFLAPRLQDLSETSRQRFDTNPLRILDTKIAYEKEILAEAPVIRDYLNAESRDHYDHVLAMLTDMGVEYRQNDLLVRGLDYYTHTTFEFTSDALGAQDAICGGGRYNDLVTELGGGEVPAIGWASGIERLLLVIEALNPIEVENRLDLYLVVLGDELRKPAAGLLQAWRSAGLQCDGDTLRRSMRAQMREANRQGTRFAAILGESEWENGEIQLKDLSSGEQVSVKLEDVISHVRELL